MLKGEIGGFWWNDCLTLLLGISWFDKETGIVIAMKIGFRLSCHSEGFFLKEDAAGGRLKNPSKKERILSPDFIGTQNDSAWAFSLFVVPA